MSRFLRGEILEERHTGPTIGAHFKFDFRMIVIPSAMPAKYRSILMEGTQKRKKKSEKLWQGRITIHRFVATYQRYNQSQ